MTTTAVIQGDCLTPTKLHTFTVWYTYTFTLGLNLLSNRLPLDLVLCGLKQLPNKQNFLTTEFQWIEVLFGSGL